MSKETPSRRPLGPPFEPPSLAVCLRAAFSAGRQAWEPQLLVGGWLCAVFLVVTTGSFYQLFAAVFAVLVLPRMVASSAWSFGRGEQLTMGQLNALLYRRAGVAVLASLFAPIAGLLLAGVAVGGSVLIGAVPFAGGVLKVLWWLLPGALLTLLGVGLLVFGLPSMPLALASGILEPSFPFESSARGMSYFRCRPLRTVACALAAVCGVLLSACVFFFAATLAALLLKLGWGTALGDLGGALSLSSLSSEVRELVSDAAALVLDPWDAGDRFRTLGALFPGSATLGFVLAGAAAGLARVYLVLRWTIEAEAPSALIRPDEEFAWLSPEPTEASSSPETKKPSRPEENP